MHHLVQFYWHTFKLRLNNGTQICDPLVPVNFQSADQGYLSADWASPVFII